MRIEQRKWTQQSGWTQLFTQPLGVVPQLVFVFGASKLASESKYFEEIKTIYPHSSILFCSTAGEIIQDEVLDDSLSVTAIYFEKTSLKFAEVDISTADQSFESGKKLADSLDKDKLVHV